MPTYPTPSYIFTDGCGEHYTQADVSTKWNGGGTMATIVSGGRNGGNCFKSYKRTTIDAMIRDLGAYYATITVGVALRYDAPGNSVNFYRWDPIIVFKRDTTIVSAMLLGSDGSIAYKVGQSWTNQPTVVTCRSVGNALVSPTSWNFLEIKTAFSTGALGSVEIRINGISVASASNVQTTNRAPENISRVGLGYFPYDFSTSTEKYYDDFYVATDFMLDSYIYQQAVNAAGSFAAWNPVGAASNYLAVDETQSDGDTTYVSSSNLGDRDSYGIQSLSTSGDVVRNVQVVMHARRDDALAWKVAPFFRIGGVNYDGTSQTIGSSYTPVYVQMYNTSPATSSEWTKSEINGAELGARNAP